MLCFARLMRCAIVASGTRNALRDLGRRQAADRAQRQRDRRRRGQRRMAAHEQEDERVVVLDVRLRLRRGRSPSTARRRDRSRGAAARFRCGCDRSCVATRPGSASRAGCRACLARPLHRRREQRFLHRVFGRGESRKRRTTAPSTCGARSRNRCSTRSPARRRHVKSLRAARSSPAALRSACSSAAAGPRRRRRLAPQSRTPAPDSRRRRSSSRRETPWFRGTRRR